MSELTPFLRAAIGFAYVVQVPDGRMRELPGEPDPVEGLLAIELALRPNELQGDGGAEHEVGRPPLLGGAAVDALDEPVAGREDMPRLERSGAGRCGEKRHYGIQAHC